MIIYVITSSLNRYITPPSQKACPQALWKPRAVPSVLPIILCYYYPVFLVPRPVPHIPTNNLDSLADQVSEDSSYGIPLR